MTATTAPLAQGRLRVRLYVAGESPNSRRAVANLHDALAGLPEDQVELEIIDVLREPHRGLGAGILMTPMLVRVAPPPERRVLGNLNDRVILLGALGLPEIRHA